jgi:riboflavin-specific deaminase-like protein
MGASTMRVYKKPCTIDQLGDKLSSQPINILVSSKLKNLDPKWDFFTDTRIKRILFVGSSTAPAQIKKFSKSSEIIVLRKISKKYPLASQITEALKHRNISRILVEGGGEIMWDFASLGLIDEFHVTLTPKILGGAKAPTLVDGEGFEPEKTLQLKLRQCKIIGDEIYLTYARRN